ncbi:hypothetical protein [Thiolapillus brandeum]|uniref:Uncharacterized protein n=1 Tax=Thiolapillus brandeum TaxID=1076588 RepID=A0A7U6GKY4_9GAMM|nr:hypothetical protein [Thiolapillus brandeum]BAO45498.1 hypothetical protein TBH_C2592 [Thiolapillus brandeum]
MSQYSGDAGLGSSGKEFAPQPCAGVHSLLCWQHKGKNILPTIIIGYEGDITRFLSFSDQKGRFQYDEGGIMSKGKLLAFAGFFAISTSNCLALSEEEYLKYIDAESSKLSEPQVPPSNTGKDNVVEGLEKKEAGALSQQEFEQLLKAKAKGTYSFYESLVEKDKAEVFKSYVHGASMSQVRRMIINRKMNR